MRVHGYFPPIISILWAPLEGVEGHFVGSCWAVVPPWNPGCVKLHSSCLGPFARVTAVSLS